MLERHPEIEIVICSPLTRALQTATIGLINSRKDRSIPFIAVEECREQAGLHICDERRSTLELSTDFPHVDFSSIVRQMFVINCVFYN